MKKIVMAFTAFLQANLIFGQCDIKLTPADNPSVAYRFRGDRCEGTYSAKVGVESIEVISFTIGAFSYKLNKTEVIKIENLTGSPIHIRSTPLPLNTYYRMDASLENNQALKWQVGEVLYDLRISSKFLGVYGWIGSEHKKTYLPVKPISSDYIGTDKKLYLIIRTKTSVKEAKFRYAAVGQHLSPYEIIASINGTHQSIMVVLPASLKGEYIIEIAALLETSEAWEVEQYKFLIK